MKVLFSCSTVKNEALITSILDHFGARYQICSETDCNIPEEYDLIIQDLSHITYDAQKLEAISRIKSSYPSVALLTLLGNSHDRLRFTALEHGADYCMVGTVNEREVQIALKSLTRGISQNKKEIFSYGPLIMDSGSRIVELDGCKVNLTPREFSLLKTLMSKPKELVDTREILSDLKKSNAEIDLQRLQPHISRLRKKINYPGLSIKSVYGSGYKLVISQ